MTLFVPATALFSSATWGFSSVEIYSRTLLGFIYSTEINYMWIKVFEVGLKHMAVTWFWVCLLLGQFLIWMCGILVEGSIPPFKTVLKLTLQVSNVLFPSPCPGLCIPGVKHLLCGDVLVAGILSWNHFWSSVLCQPTLVPPASHRHSPLPPLVPTYFPHWGGVGGRENCVWFAYVWFLIFLFGFFLQTGVALDQCLWQKKTKTDQTEGLPCRTKPMI